MMLSLTSDQLAQSHAIRIAAAAKGGALAAVSLGHANRRRLLEGYKQRGRMILADKNTTIPSIPIALEYLNDLMPDPPLMPRRPADRAALRIYIAAAGGDALEGADTCSDAALKFWDWTTGALIRGRGCLTLGVCDVEMSISLADCAAFPILHRLLQGHRAQNFRLPSNIGLVAASRWLEARYALPCFGDSMTDGERRA